MADALRDELLEALKLAMPVLQGAVHVVNASYGRNFSPERAETTRRAYESARKALESAAASKSVQATKPEPDMWRVRYRRSNGEMTPWIEISKTALAAHRADPSCETQALYADPAGFDSCASRAMFVARLRNRKGRMTSDDVLWLLNDCDMAAEQEVIAIAGSGGAS